MKYIKSNDRFYLRLDIDDELISKLNEFCVKENISSASVAGIGACKNPVIGFFNIETKKYEFRNFSGDFEITSLVGNITKKEGLPFVHLHINCGDKDGNIIGGHLNSAVISVTCEIFIDVFEKEINRVQDTKTGLFLTEFKN